MADQKSSSLWSKSLNISDIFGWKDHGEYGAVAAIVIGILVPLLFSALFLGKKRGKVRGVPVEVGGEAGYAVRNARRTELIEVPWKGAPTMAHLFEQSCNKYTHNRFLGTRKLIGKESVTASDGRKFEKLHLGDYEWETYGEVFIRVSNFASGLIKLGHNIDSRVAIFSDTRAEWLIALQGCFRQNITVVTIYASLGEDALIHSLNETQVSTLICDPKLLKKLEAIRSKLTSIQNIIYFEDDSKEEEPAFSGDLSNWTIASFGEVEKLGKESPVEPSLPSKNAIAVVMYTSGSTGLPKGVMITHGNIVATTAAVMTVIPNLGSKDVYLAYLPLAHVFEMAAESVMLATGVAIGYGSTLTLTDTSNKIKKGTKGDATMLKPTLLTAVPAIIDRVRDGVVKKVEEKGGLAKNLFQIAYNRRLAAVKGSWLGAWGLEKLVWDTIVFKKIRTLLGGHLRFMLCGGAPLSGDSQHFINICMGNMARPLSMISEIKTLRQTLRVAVRITRLWFVENRQYPPTLEIILMDAKGDKIHATVRDKDLLAKWKPILKEGDCYEMQNFIVQRADGQYRNTNHIFKFIFSTGTIAKEIECSEIPTNCYRFTSFDDIVSGKASTAILVDVIGQLIDCGKYYPDAEKKKATISLKDQFGKVLKCTLWEGHASKLTNYIDNNKGIPIIIILTQAKIQDPIDNYPVAISNSKWSSTLLINNDIKEINDFKSSLGVIEIYDSGSQVMSQISGSSQYSQSSQWSTMDRFFYKADVMTLAEICNLRQETQCCTIATIDNVLAGYGWSYDHCTRCNKSARTCGCGDQNNKIETRFRVEVMVSYKEDSTKFVLWDNDCKELLKCTAIDLKKQMIGAGQIDPMAIPATVDNLEGKTLAFKVKVQPRYRRASVVKASEEQQIIEQVIKQFPVEELHTDAKGKAICSIKSPTSDKQIESTSIDMDIANLEQSQSLSATADFDPEALDTITPAKRLSAGMQFDDIPTQDLGSTQLSSTKLAKHIKME